MRGNFCLYPTKIGDVGRKDNKWQPEWIDTVENFTRLCHKYDLKIFTASGLLALSIP